LRIFTLLTVAALCAGCASVAHQADVPHIAADQSKIVFVADGAGDYRLASKNIRETVKEDKLPMDIETFIWSHGPHHVVIDQMDSKNTQAQGVRLAELVRETHQAYPDKEISLVGHSAGCFVVLTAAEQLPPDSIEHIVLMNPSVPADYDLRPALKTCHCVDVHCSNADRFYLGMLVGILSACKGVFTAPAGLGGFKLQPKNGDDAVLISRLHQIHWRPEFKATGNDGGHYGCYQHGYLREYILPELLTR
jgi:pimeloyl-ACP methyl ester carboxylesterase